MTVYLYVDHLDEEGACELPGGVEDVDGHGQLESPGAGEHLCRVEVQEGQGEARGQAGAKLREAEQNLV